MIGLLFFISFIAAIIGATIFFLKEKHQYVFVSLLMLTLIPRLWLITNPALGNNDEKYHALVAKNLQVEPLVPLLYVNPVLAYQTNDWTGNHVWLSKPPTALWIMSASIKIFGANVIGVRLGSLILSLLGAVVIFLLGKRLFGIQEGLIAMFLLTIHGTLIELGAGEISSDHVDLCFNVLFLTTVYLAVKSSQANQHLILHYTLCGILFGLLFLTKYHASLVVLPICLFIFFINRQTTYKFITNLLLFVLASLLITVPWLAFIHYHYPAEFLAMKDALISPISQVTQGHSGPWYYYIDKIGKLYGEFIYLALTLLIIAVIRKRQWQLSLLLLWVTIPLLAFSLIETKRFTYILVLAPSIFLLIGYIINQRITRSFIPKWFQIIFYAGLLALPIRFSIERVDYFTDRTKPALTEEIWRTTLLEFASKTKPKKTVIFDEDRYIETMFYTDCIAYPYRPDQKTIEDLKKQGYSCYLASENSYLPI